MLVYTGGCNGCDIEIVNAVFSPKFDAEQYKIFLTWNPREADVLIVTGPVTKHNEKPLKEIYDAIPEPKAVIAAGACALMGGVYKNIHGDIPSEEISGPVDQDYTCGCKSSRMCSKAGRCVGWCSSCFT